jgi:hypothetical protein
MPVVSYISASPVLLFICLGEHAIFPIFKSQLVCSTIAGLWEYVLIGGA